VTATQEQVRELAAAIAAQAQAIAEGSIPEEQQYSQVLRLRGNIETLQAWTPDSRQALIDAQQAEQKVKDQQRREQRRQQAGS
jgi:hypothetical protein